MSCGCLNRRTAELPTPSNVVAVVGGILKRILSKRIYHVHDISTLQGPAGAKVEAKRA